jgi:hypothetical protein
MSLTDKTYRAPMAPLNAASKGTVAAAIPEPAALPEGFCADAFTEF